MIRKYFSLLLVSVAWLGMSGCGSSGGSPASVLKLGVKPDSVTGSMRVAPGDTVYSISKRYQLSRQDIIDLNGLKPPYTLALGQRIKLPPPVNYRAKNRDTLTGISNMFGVSLSKLAQVNGLSVSHELSYGQNLKIPSSVIHGQQQTVSQKVIFQAISQQVVLLKSPRPVLSPRPVSILPLEEKKEVSQVKMLSTPTRTDFVWPVRGSVVSAYGSKKEGLYNDGINIAAPRGTPVAAAAAGVVAYVGSDLESYGNLVLIRHGGGIMTAYAHLASVRIKKGMTVRKGQAIGSVGATGAVSSSQIHFEIRRGSGTCDPMQYLG